jgi:Spy/CpxP family protein refolding chaperone
MSGPHPTRSFTAAALLLAALAAAPATAQLPRRGPGPDGHGHDLARVLELTEQQQEQWRAAHEAHRAAIEPLLEQLHANHDAVEAAIETGDPTAVGEAVLAGRALHQQLVVERDGLEQAVLEILDDEQEAQYTEHRERRRRFDHGHGFGGHERRRGPAPSGAQ